MANSININSIVLTLDIDWAPDFMIDFAAEQLISHNVKATWFITHDSPAVKRLGDYPYLFELGIHPNFLPGSTHGQTPEEVLSHCMQLVPDAVSMRTHALIQSSPLLAQIMKETSIKRDVSLFLPYHPNLQPVSYWWEGRHLLRIPYFWEDDVEMQQPEPNWHFDSRFCGGVKIFDFHPVHVYLNSKNMMPYETLKQKTRGFSDSVPAYAKNCIQCGKGTGTLFEELLIHITDNRKAALRICDISKDGIK